MEPSSTAFCRAGALLTMIALISIAMCESAAARGLATMGRVQAVRVVPRIPVQPRALQGGVAHRQVLRPANPALLGNPFPSHRFRRTTRGFYLPYDPYLVDTGQPGAPAFPGDYEFGPAIEPFVQPACVRPLIIQIKPRRHATHFPRVIYGRPLPC